MEEAGPNKCIYSVGFMFSAWHRVRILELSTARQRDWFEVAAYTGWGLESGQEQGAFVLYVCARLNCSWPALHGGVYNSNNSCFM